MELTIVLTDEQVEQIARRAADLLADRQQASPFLSADEAAEYLRCKKARVYDLVQLGQLVPVRDGRRVLFRRSDLDRYLGAS